MTTETQTQSKSIGALWEKRNFKTNELFYSGKITLPDETVLEIVVFKNSRKEKPNQPDFNIMKSRPKTENYTETKKDEVF